jgi:phosphinothricin acetyltransferase
MARMKIRPATAADLSAINRIYNHFVAVSTCTYATQPTSDEERQAWWVAHRERHPVTVAEDGHAVIGWASLSTWNIRSGYNATVESSVYIHADHHRRGVGKALMVDLIERAKAIGHHTILAGISADQAPSIALHEALGFERISHFRQVGFKFGRWLDVIHMQLMLDTEPRPKF